MRKLTRHKFAFICFLLITLGLLGATGYLFYNLLLLKNIETFLRTVSMVVIGIIVLILILFAIRFLRKYKKIKLVLVFLLMIILAGGQTFVAYNIGKVYGTLTKVTDNTEYTTYSASLVTLASNEAEKLKDISEDDALGVLEDETSIEGSVIPSEVIKKKELINETKEYSGFIEMIDALKNGEINYIFLPTNYDVRFGTMEGYEDLDETTKVIYTQTKKVKKEAEKTSTKPITEPFSILLMGVDSEMENLADSSFNGDSLMVLTFNPKTLSSTILSIPRDSYVPIACFDNQRKNKITHAAWQGESCMQKTIENFLDIDIDYYVKINFKGVVKLVDTLGGVEVDVPYSLCEQDSNRQWGENTVYIEEGHQKLNGEQALAFARNRHPNPSKCSAKWTNYTSNDFIRGQHQQEIVEALLNKFKDVKSLDTVYDLLDTISSSMATNMSTEQILSLYNVLKDVAKNASDGNLTDALNIQKLYLSGSDARIIDYGGTNLSLYNYVLYDESVKAVSNAMKVNLGEKKEKVIKKFSFNINEPYEEEVIGKMDSGTNSITLLPSFVGQSLSYVNSFCGANGIKVNVSGSGSGTVISQSVAAGANVEDVSSITVTLAGAVANNRPSSSSSSNNSSSSTNETEKEEEKTEEPTEGGSVENDGGSGGGQQDGGSGTGSDPAIDQSGVTN